MEPVRGPFHSVRGLRWLPGLVSTETDRGNADSVVGLKNTDTLSFGGIKKRNLKKNKKKNPRGSIHYVSGLYSPPLFK